MRKIKLRELSIDDIGDLVRELLEGFYWLPGLKPNTRYARLHDDNDGKLEGFLSVTIGEDGDAWVSIDSNAIDHSCNDLRFRMPLHGGGESPRVRTALMILAEAIRLDNEELPLRPPPAEVVAARSDPLASLRWVCRACNTSNGIDDAVCVACNKPKP